MTSRVLATASAVAVGSGATYLGLITGAAPLDLGIGRRTRPLGPQVYSINAPRDLVFSLIEAPYSERTTRAMRKKVQVLARGQDLVLAAHRTPLRGSLVATTVETVKFTPPERFEFRLVRGPVPHVVETFELEERDGATVLRYDGEIGTDLWGLGQRWGDLVAASWEATVRSSLGSVKAEAERRYSHPRDQ